MAKSESANQTPLTFKYILTLPGGERKEFATQLDRKTLSYLQPARSSYPEWTALSYRKCSNCPLNETEHPQCPAAVSVIDVVEAFGASVSYDEVLVRVEAEERSYESKVPTQKALSGLVGLRMATSGCPVVRKLRPMTRHHLPFSSLYETRFRILSMYLLSQYLRSKQGEQPDWAMNDLAKYYKDIQTVNQDFTRRLLPATKGDASVNAIVILNAFADAIEFSISGEMLDELRQVFDTARE